MGILYPFPSELIRVVAVGIMLSALILSGVVAAPVLPGGGILLAFFGVALYLVAALP